MACSNMMIVHVQQQELESTAIVGHLLQPSDNASVGSTETNDNNEDKVTVAHSQSQYNYTNARPLKKQVRIDCSLNKEYSNTEYSKSELRQMALWFSKDELAMFKAANLKWAFRIAQLEQRNKSTTSYRNVVERLYRACQTAQSDLLSLEDLLSKEDRQQLCYWAEVATSRIGVEAIALQQIKADRFRRRNELMIEVVRIQEDYDSELDDLESLLFETSRRLSKTTRLFTQAMAEAYGSCFESDLSPSQNKEQ